MCQTSVANIEGWPVLGWFTLAARLVRALLDFCASWGQGQ